MRKISSVGDSRLREQGDMHNQAVRDGRCVSADGDSAARANQPRDPSCGRPLVGFEPMAVPVPAARVAVENSLEPDVGTQKDR